MPRSPRLTGLCAVSDSCCNCAGSELRRLPLRSEVRKPLKPAASNLLELTVQDMADSNSRDIETQSFSLVSWNTFGGAGRLRRRKSCYQRVAIRRTKPRASVPTGTSLIAPIVSDGDVVKCCFHGCRVEQRVKVADGTRGMLVYDCN